MVTHATNDKGKAWERPVMMNPRTEKNATKGSPIAVQKFGFTLTYFFVFCVLLWEGVCWGWGRVLFSRFIVYSDVW